MLWWKLMPPPKQYLNVTGCNGWEKKTYDSWQKMRTSLKLSSSLEINKISVPNSPFRLLQPRDSPRVSALARSLVPAPVEMDKRLLQLLQNMDSGTLNIVELSINVNLVFDPLCSSLTWMYWSPFHLYLSSWPFKNTTNDTSKLKS